MTELMSRYQENAVQKRIHLQGILKSGEDGMKFEDGYDTIARTIAGQIASCNESRHQPEDDYRSDYSLCLPEVFLRFYLSDKKVSLEEAEEKQIMMSIGELDIYTEWYGYSEYTIEGYCVENFTIGNHDIESILKTYKGKYAHIIMEIY
ncbi:hypothetical protein TCA2_4569 [Paenibacillus sp. TCA20]|uniref:hypothetical protein n=1 Tax=Paenibacillus sp. TCA20 TaxID=1499968 RepID=UPI0004D4DCF2|nr:hypothetical protein [Paenibacillus sp. TCA20]GAK42077.1 hypothetical protein TCA2_4569 [Paenibacillus sp. TCA20]